MPERIDFVRQSIHTISHMASETQRVGPGAYGSQWPLERTIGDLGQQIKQPSRPYANLSQRGLLQAQINALRSMIPDLDGGVVPQLPHGAQDLGNGYVLLRAMDNILRPITPAETEAIRVYVLGLSGVVQTPTTAVTRWARLRLPNGQVARTLWKESRKPLNQLRMSRNVKVLYFLLVCS